MRTFKAPGAAAAAAPAAARGATAATKAAGAATAPPPPAPRRPAGAGTQVSRKKASEATAESQVSEVPVGPPPPPAETVEDLRAQQKAARESNVFPVLGTLGMQGNVTLPGALTKNRGSERTWMQAAADVARADIIGELGDMVLGRDLRDRMRSAIGEYVPEIISPTPAGREKKNIAGRDVVVYPRYDILRANDRGPAQLARLAREAETPGEFEWRRNNLRVAFGLAKKDYKSAVAQADTKFQDKKLSPAAIEDSALKARERLQKVVDLREALRELKEPEDNLSID